MTRSAILLALALAACGSDLDEADPAVRSAFFGLDDALPEVVNVICPGGAGMDGMPVVFTRELDGETIQASDFVVTTAGGASQVPSCATPLPSGESNENRTVLLVGDFGDAIADPPVRLDIVGSLQTEPDASGRSVDLEGTAFAPVTPLEAGPFLVFAERMEGDERELGNPPAIGVGAGCPVDGTEQVVKVVWAGGVKALSGEELGDAERVRYRVILEDGSEIVPFALADLHDQDNNHDLCLDDARRPIRVEMEAGTVIDPGGDANPATGVEVRMP